MFRSAQHDKRNTSTLIIQRSPEIPSRNRTIGTPFFAALDQLLRGGQFSSAKSFGETFSHSVIVDRPDIRPTEIEKKEHLNRPAANPAHLRKARDDLVIAHPKKRVPGRDRAVNRFRRKVFNRCRLCARQAGATKSVVGCRENFCRIKPLCFGVESADTAENSCCSFAAQLLVSNRFCQRVEGAN